MTYYYVDKDAGRVGAFLHWLAKVDFVHNPNFSPPASGFLIGVFAENPDRVRGWVADVTPNAEAKDVIERALWMSGHADLISEVFHDTPEYAAQQPPTLMTLALDTPGMWDVMWAAFSATGNAAYPARLIDLLGDGVTFTGNPNVDASYRRTIAWSLTSNMSRHERILRMVRKEAPLRTGAVQRKLQEMLDKVDAERVVMPDCDGDFCASMTLVREEDLNELDKPYDEIPVLTGQLHAKTGNHIAVVISFSGIGLTDDLSADVSSDIRTLRPDGAVYGGEHKKLEILKQKVPQRFSIFDNRPALQMIRFEPQDPRGTYRVEAVVTDHVGHKSVSLTKDITLDGE